MRQQATGVAVVTTAHQGPVGFCASSVASVCLDPPTLSFAVSSGGASGAAWTVADGGLVHVLHDGQQSVAERFARDGASRFDGRHPWSWSPEGYPELADRLALLAIHVTTRLVVGDHLVVIGAVDRVEARDELRPLAYHAGRFCRVAPIAVSIAVPAVIADAGDIASRNAYHGRLAHPLTSVPSPVNLRRPS